MIRILKGIVSRLQKKKAELIFRSVLKQMVTGAKTVSVDKFFGPDKDEEDDKKPLDPTVIYIYD